MQAINIVKEFIKMGLTDVKIEYDKERNLFYYDLNTGAKSGLHLFDDFHVEGRYDYSNQITIDDWDDMETVLEKLFWEFHNCIKGRDFYNLAWMEIGCQLGCVEKKVNTITNVTYE